MLCEPESGVEKEEGRVVLLRPGGSIEPCDAHWGETISTPYKEGKSRKHFPVGNLPL